MKVLALEPFYGGSHKSFLDGCAKYSRHNWTLLTLPPFKWKWRMRHSAVIFAQQVNVLIEQGKKFDIIFCSDMLPLAGFKGLVNITVAKLPSIIYFHENQLTYPVQIEKERDLHFAVTNFISMTAANQVWFNSSFHKESFLSALQKLLRSMPDYNLLSELEHIQNKSIVFPQAIHKNNYKRELFAPPVHIGWVARFEFDKNPEMFFSVLQKLKNQNIPFKLSVIGEQFKNSPEIFDKAKKIFDENIVNWGYISSYSEYQKALTKIDILVSTADHEFFGVSVLEAIDAGVYPLLPQKLSYPELLQLNKKSQNKKFFYDGSEINLENKLLNIVDRFNNGTVSFNLQEIANQYYWTIMGTKLDNALKKLL